MSISRDLEDYIHGSQSISLSSNLFCLESVRCIRELVLAWNCGVLFAERMVRVLCLLYITELYIYFQ
jgi:hypothetical protein